MNNIIIYGESRTNKTNGVIIPKINEWEGGVLIIDSSKSLKNKLTKNKVITYNLNNLLLYMEIDFTINEILLNLKENFTVILKRDEKNKDTNINGYILNSITEKIIQGYNIKPILFIIDEFDSFILKSNVRNKTISNSKILYNLLNLNTNHNCTTIIALQNITRFKNEYNYEKLSKICDLINSKDCKEFSGELRVRFPKSLHKELSLRAEIEDVSLNQYIVYLLTKGLKE